MNKSNKFKKIILISIILELFLSYTNAFAVATIDGYDYSNAGISTQIKQYLCAPTDVPASQTNLTNGALNSPSNFQQNAAYGNANSSDLYNCINRMYRFAIILAGVVGVFFIVIAGYVYMSAEGNDESVSKAKDILVSTISSMAILMGGFILLKAINPDLIQFRSVQPPSIKISDLRQLAEPTSSEMIFNQLETETYSGTPPANTPKASANGSVAQLNAAGCTIDPSRPAAQLPNLQEPIWNILLKICSEVKATGNTANVTSTVRPESKGSAHALGCAIDFSSGGDGFFNIVTKTGRPAGVAIYNAAIKNGISESRINPGVDRKQTYHIHIDMRGQPGCVF